MQDRYRFRFWNKKTNKWFYFGFETFLTYEKEIWEALTNGEKIYQCTGLKDKTGKLIYESDIIKLPNDYGTYGMFAGEKREVYFYEGGFRLKPKWDKSSRGNWLEDTNDFEVIGNIYENTELLKDGE